MRETAYAKLNMTLDVLGARDDGYHDLCSVMQSVSLCDEVDVRLTEDGRTSCASSLRYLPGDERNIAVKAARLFFQAAGLPDRGARIFIQKRIPVCAGLGGGSSDAAAVLRALNILTRAGLSRGELEVLSRALGSDVPFCVAGGTALAEGRGEALTDLAPLPACPLVICKPEFSISTPELFSKIDARRSRCRPDTEGLLRAVAEGDLPGAARRMYNVFEDVLPRQYGEVAVIKNRLLDFGALGVTMSGTGSAVFGIFDAPERAEAAYRALRAGYRDTFLAEPVGKIDI